MRVPSPIINSNLCRTLFFGPLSFHRRLSLQRVFYSRDRRSARLRTTSFFLFFLHERLFTLDVIRRYSPLARWQTRTNARKRVNRKPAECAAIARARLTGVRWRSRSKREAAFRAAIIGECTRAAACVHVRGRASNNGNRPHSRRTGKERDWLRCLRKSPRSTIDRRA